MITKVDSKKFAGKGIIHVAVFKRKDKLTIYNMVYRDGTRGSSYIKRFAVTGVTRDKEYDLTNGAKGTKVWYFSANPNGEAEVVAVLLRQVGSIKKLKWDIDFADVLIKGRASKGNLVTKNSIKRIELKEKGVSTLKPRKIWFDDTVQRLNVDARGELMGDFRGEDRLLVISQSGMTKTIMPELTTHFDANMIVLEKWILRKPISAIYFDGEKERYYVKRFIIENENKEELFITDHKNSQLEIASTDWKPVAELVSSNEYGKDRKEQYSNQFRRVYCVKRDCNTWELTNKREFKPINLLDPLSYKVPEEIHADDIEVVDEETVSLEKTEVEDEPNAKKI